MLLKYVAVVSSFFLGILFLFAGVDKLFHMEGFVNALASYVIFPERAAPYLAMPIILTELWIGLGLMIRRFRGAAALTASIVLLVFTFALLVNYIYAPGAVCGCWFTITLATSTPLHIALNVVLMALAISVLMSTLPIGDLHEVVMPAHAGQASKSPP